VTKRGLGWILIAYGIVGMALVLATGWLVLEAAGRVEDLAAGAERTLDAAALSTAAAAEAASGVDASLSESLASARNAAELARDASATLSSLGRSMQVSIFGAQPLLPLADDFATSASQAADLGDTLDRLGESLESSVPAVSRIGVELDRLAAELRGMRDAVGGSADAPPMIVLMLLVLAWLLMPAAAGLVAGLALIGLIRPLRPWA
jgi:hypothetical protein